MIITKHDVGRKVRLRDGSIRRIIRVYTSKGRTIKGYAVELDNYDCYTTSGSFRKFDSLSSLDIIDFVDSTKFLIDKKSDFTLCIERNESTNTITYGSGLTLELSDSELDKFITDDFILLE